MTAVEVAVATLIDLAQDKTTDPHVRCDAARALLVPRVDGALEFTDYDDHGKKV